MANIETAVKALINVAKTTIKAQTSDPTYGDVFTRLQFREFMQLDTLDVETLAIYEVTGASSAQGLGYVKQWRNPTVRVDVFSGKLANARQICEQARSAFINDFNLAGGNSGAVGQGYLRQTGGIKYISFSDFRNAPLEKREFFRRQFDVILEIGD